MKPTADKAPVRRALLRWFARHQRTLPWRSEPTPYRVWISEIMLQQTQVATVLPYFERFVRRFPGVASLARADLSDVLTLWAGLGYYSRARNLHAAAKAMAERFAGKVPDTLDGLRALPGVGRYTAGAILSIAFNRPAAILDGNVARVLARLFAIGGDVRSSANQRRLWALAEELVDPRRPGDFNQAMMELGALVCVPAAPACGRCPLRAMCGAAATGQPTTFGSPGRRPAARPERWAVAIVRRGPRVAMVRRAEAGRWAGLWEFPGAAVPEGEEAGRFLRTFLRRTLGSAPRELRPVGQVRHQLTHRSMTVEVFAGEVAVATRRANAAWVATSEALERPVSKLTRKIAAAALAGNSRPERFKR